MGKERKKDDWDLWSLKRWVLPTSAKKGSTKNMVNGEMSRVRLLFHIAAILTP